MNDYTKYFKENANGFDRFINKLYQKYQSLSKFTGSIKLSTLTKEESITLSRFFGVNYKENETITIPIKRFLTIMNNSKYEDFDIETLIKEYLNVELITNKESKQNKENSENAYYETIINSSNSLGTNWLKEVIDTKINPYKLIHQRYNQNKKLLEKDLTNIITLINNLPLEKTLLSIYASSYTKDPHYLDIDSKNSVLFFYALAFIDNTDFPKTRESKIKLLSKYNIEIDAVSNFVITYNLLSNKSYISEFAHSKEPLILNIKNILNTTFDTKTKKVYIFENPSILTEIISKDIDASVIISGGFPNTSVYLLIDALIKTNNHIYYNGDFDPEGLLIADKLKDKYKYNLTLFCYEELDYKNCISKKKIIDSRLSKLSKINSEELFEIRDIILKTNTSAYQENNKERLLDYIKNNS